MRWNDWNTKPSFSFLIAGERPIVAVGEVHAVDPDGAGVGTVEASNRG